MISDSSAAKIFANGLREMVRLFPDIPDLSAVIEEFSDITKVLQEKYPPQALAAAVLLAAAEVLEGVGDAFEEKVERD